MRPFTAMSAREKITWRRRSAQLGLIWGSWTLVGLIFTSQYYFTFISTERPVAWSDALYRQFLYSYLWALATPLVLWLARRFPFERQNWPGRLFVHTAVGTALIFIILGTHTVCLYLYFVRPEGEPLSVATALRTILFNSTESFAIYWLILLLSQSLSYYRRYQEELVTKAELKAQLTQAQLQALKMQLHPHFLFNTLHSISALLNQDREVARSMIARLGDFLRLTLENAGAQEVTLQKEIEFLRCYLEIERIRFQDRLTTHIHVDPQALKARVPNLILQPIVENAIKHGIAPRSAPGRIEIRAEHLPGLLRIRVKDNGSGLPLNGHSADLFKQGLGLANTRARLEQLYGAGHRFELANDPEGGLVVTLEIPSDPAASAERERNVGANGRRSTYAGVSS